ncbi:cell division cycle-associated protein 3 [Anolis carolinensis]|uniref:Cell division cycle associated 3 n=1 Tax=Anolis carolinensis TaxID=28377 RepID=H9GAJ8_ANOCA|nr:PREDICTED: cell division cycle-associated protein 3 [Anolis carolinensis]XP_008118452.1 PREDICTED: cell division cycle-associated protein 3 [Anolis carolinensis]XP_008118453.1 PREDICTED: cell division cycle-associated protein 3 [Anolis carolinensis]XP_016852715.1 PREDICTED: cell division cycle-associated protein 3 [Anolis carolinensis]|eukprot:XP_003227151.1 PREDICTED: cell division cycle-associated protein 3 [Anolis carolinensis]
MGASESCPATPTCKPLLNKHLTYVHDPRSPTAGILRTPIEVQNSPQESPLTILKDDNNVIANKQDLSWDPRSPTPGISRTPMKAVLADVTCSPVKQLSEDFLAENMEEKLSLEESHHVVQKPDIESVAEVASEETKCVEVSQGDPLGAEEERNEQPSISVAAVTKPAPLTSALPPAGVKPTRRRVNSKMRTVPTGAGRSPLSILRDDNSPSALLSHQSKRCLSAADGQVELKEGMFNSGRVLKAGSYNWPSFNKENQRQHLVEN